VTPPQSTLASLAPRPQANPLEALARTDPDAALIVQKQRQAQQEFALKRQGQQLEWGLKSIEAVAQMSQGVTNQADLDRVRADMQQVAPQAAARLPQFYSEEAMEAFQQSALRVKDRQELKIADVQAQADLVKARMSGRVATTDQYLKALGVVPGQETPQDMQKALALEQQDKQALSASHGTGQIVPTQEGLTRINPRTGEVEVIKGPQGQTLYPPASGEAQKAQTYGDLAQKAHAEAVALEDKGLKPSLWDKGAQSLPLGLGNYLVSEDRKAYTNAVNRFGEAWLRKTSGAVLSPTEYKLTDETYFPQPNDSKARIESKRAAREAVIKGMQAEGQQTGRQQAPSGGQASPAPTGTSGQGALKPVTEMSREELLAERDRLRGGR